MPRPVANSVSRALSAPAAAAARLLVCCDDLHHPGANVRAGLAPILDACAGCADWNEGTELLPAEALSDYAAVVLSKANVLAARLPRPWLEENDTRLLDYVHGGGGLLVVHSGLAGHERVPAMRAVAGGAFLHHPPACDVTLELEGKHPLTEGAEESFAVFDEHYFVAVDDPAAEIFLTARSAHGVQPAGWTRQEGDGRVCALAPGHFPAVWRHPRYQALLHRALRWVAGEGRQRPDQTESF